ncbi:MAG TPA: Gfo/Idh/MocA family oxidoreductase [Pirellulales bacterium]
MAPRNVSRRDFFRSTAVAAGALAASTAQAASPNSRVRVALVGCGLRGMQHLDALAKLSSAGSAVEVVGVSDVFSSRRDKAVAKLGGKSNAKPFATADYRDLLAREDVDAVCLATPDHWHATMTLDALAAGKHVYVERPFVHRIEEIAPVLDAYRDSGRVVQVGAQRTSDARWTAARDYLQAGRIGKVLQAQTEYFRNSSTGQWRWLGLSRDMTPSQIDWKRFLGVERGLNPETPFDRAKFAQWRCYWSFGSGPFGELMTPRVTEMLLALGATYPRRVVGSGGIFWEYDGRDVPDSATVVADFAEGSQLLLTGVTGNDHAIEHCIRGRLGTLRFDLSRDGFQFLPQRPQATRVRDARSEYVAAAKPRDETLAHWENFLQAIAANDPAAVSNTPDLAAAAASVVLLGLESYRTGRALEWDSTRRLPMVSGPEYAHHWERLSQQQQAERDSGWKSPSSRGGGEICPPDFQKLAGPWRNEWTDPAV